jgi:hypothetical protein
MLLQRNEGIGWSKLHTPPLLQTMNQQRLTYLVDFMESMDEDDISALVWSLTSCQRETHGSGVHLSGGFSAAEAKAHFQRQKRCRGREAIIGGL